MKSRTLVYYTKTRRICPDYCQPVAQCQCAANKRALATASGAAADGVLRVQRETKGRGGKIVTLVRGLALDALASASEGEK